MIQSSISLSVLTVLLIIFLLLDPLEIIYVGGVYLNNNVSFYLKPVLLLLHGHGIMLLLFTTSSFLSLILLYGYLLVQFYTIELRIGLKKSLYVTRIFLRESPKNLRHVYRSFQVLHKYVLNIHGPLLLCADGIIMISLIYVNFTLIRYWHDLKDYVKAPLIVQNILNGAGWAGVLQVGIILNQSGTKVVGSWKKKNWNGNLESKIMKRFSVSCKPLLFAYGSQYVIRSHSLLIFFKAVIRGTFRTLLSLKTYG